MIVAVINNNRLFLKMTSQYLSQRFPIPKILCLNSDITCPNRPSGRSGRGNLQDDSDVCAWPVAIPKRIVAAVLNKFDTGTSGVKYHPLAPKSTIDVSYLASLVAIRMANLLSHFRAILLLLSFLSGGSCQERCWAFNFDALSMLLNPRRRVDVGLPDDSDGILHLAGNLLEITVVGLRVGSLAN